MAQDQVAEPGFQKPTSQKLTKLQTSWLINEEFIGGRMSGNVYESDHSEADLGIWNGVCGLPLPSVPPPLPLRSTARPVMHCLRGDAYVSLVTVYSNIHKQQ